MSFEVFNELCGEISVCVDCRDTEAHGEFPPDRDMRSPEPWSILGFGFHATPGGEHSEYCDAENSGECDCDDKGFSHYTCDACGTYLAGDRFAYTLWRTSLDSARKGHAEYITAARRPDMSIASRVSLLETAGEWRKYLTDRLNEERRFAQFMSSRRLVTQ